MSIKVTDLFDKKNLVCSYLITDFKNVILFLILGIL